MYLYCDILARIASDVNGLFKKICENFKPDPFMVIN